MSESDPELDARCGPRPWRWWSGAIVLTTIVGCGGEPAPGPPARPVGLSDADPWVAHAIEQACVAVEASPRDAAAWAVLGDLFYVHDYFGLAIDAYGASLELRSDRPRVRYMLAVSRRADGDTAGALQDLALARALDAGTPHLRWRAAEWSLDQGDLDRAGAFAEEAVALGPDDRNSNRMLARVRLEQGRHDEAIALTTPWLDADPTDAELRSLRGRALRSAGRLEEAERDMLLAGDQEPTWFDDWINQALVRRTDLAWWVRRVQRTANDGQSEAARRLLGELRRWHPESRDVDFTEGVVLVSEGRLSDAIVRFDALVDADPTWAAARLRAAAARLARADAATDPVASADDRVAAEALLSAALENEPDNEAALELIAAARERLGRPADAVAPRRALVGRVPGDRGHRLGLARVLLAAGDPDATIHELDRAIEDFGPEGMPAKVVRVDALVAAGRSVEARAVVDEVASRTPRHPALAVMRRSLSGAGTP